MRCGHCGGNILRDGEGEETCLQCGRPPGPKSLFVLNKEEGERVRRGERAREVPMAGGAATGGAVAQTIHAFQAAAQRYLALTEQLREAESKVRDLTQAKTTADQTLARARLQMDEALQGVGFDTTAKPKYRGGRKRQAVTITVDGSHIDDKRLVAELAGQFLREHDSASEVT